MHTTLPAPIGKGFIVELKDRYVARWNAYVLDAATGGKKKVTHGPYELGRKVSHGPGLKSAKQAETAWDAVRHRVFAERYPRSIDTPTQQKVVQSFAGMKVKTFITEAFEPRREWEDNSRINWEYYRDAFINPAFGDLLIPEMNDENRVKAFIHDLADRNLSWWTVNKALQYTRAILELANALGVIRGNMAKLVKLPKRVKRPVSQPAISVSQFQAISKNIKSPRDRIILKILFLCAVRRGELFTLKWKDFVKSDEGYTLNIERSFCARTHQVKEWQGKAAGTGKAPAKVAVPPGLASDIAGWRKFGDTDGTDPDSYIFPTRNGTPIIATNWAEDILKPAGKDAGVPGVSFHWFRRGHATVQHHSGKVDKAIQGQLRHSKAETTREVYMQHVGSETRRAVADLESAVLAV